MNVAALRDVIAGEPANASRSDAEVLAWLRDSSGRFLETRITARGLYAFLGPIAAETILQKLEAVAQAQDTTGAIVRRALQWLDPAAGGLDVGLDSTRGMLVQLAAGGVLTPEERDAVLGLALPAGSRYEAAGLPLMDDASLLDWIGQARALS